MKKGVFTGPSGMSPAKRKRRPSLTHGGCSSPVGTPKPSVNHDLARWRQAPQRPNLGAASKDWEFPDIEKVNISAAKDWEEAAKNWADASAADAAAKKKSERKEAQKQQQKPKAKAAAPVRIPPQATTAAPMKHSIPMSSSATVVTNSTGGSSRSGGSSGIYSGSNASSTMNTTGSSSRSGGSSGVGWVIDREGLSTISSVTGHHSNAGQPPPAPPPATLATPAVAKATLYQFYGKKPRRKQLSNEDYLCWNNGGRPHELKFTAIFQCPLTGECFASGRYGDPKFYEVRTARNDKGQEVQMVWFTKKAFAEHGAAARCYDCLMYREAKEQGGSQAVQGLAPMGSDPAYGRSQAPAFPRVPNLVLEKITQNKQRIKDFMGAP